MATTITLSGDQTEARGIAKSLTKQGFSARTAGTIKHAVRLLKRVGYDRLVLTACHPLYSAAERIVVFARLVRMQPRGAAAGSTENRSSPTA